MSRLSLWTRVYLPLCFHALLAIYILYPCKVSLIDATISVINSRHKEVVPYRPMPRCNETTGFLKIFWQAFIERVFRDFNAFTFNNSLFLQSLSTPCGEVNCQFVPHSIARLIPSEKQITNCLVKYTLYCVNAWLMEEQQF